MRIGLISRRHRPVYWSPSSLSALAEAELSYVDDHRSQAVYVTLPVEECSSALKSIIPPNYGTPSLMIWTTTPWTLPSNMAVAVHADMLYNLVRCADSRLVVVATARLEALNQTGVLEQGWASMGEISGTLFLLT